MTCNCQSYNRPDWGGTEPEVILDFARYFPDTEKPRVCVDPCIAATIESLWAAGIRTRGCCCGHNRAAASVILDDPEDALRAAEILRADGRQWHVMFWVSAA